MSEDKKRLTPLKAIRTYCLWCCNGNIREIVKCQDSTCDLYPYRYGKRNKNAPRTPVKAIAKRCFNCSGFDYEERRECCHANCELYKFRLGKNPNFRPRNKVHNIENLAFNYDIAADKKNEMLLQV